MGNREKECESRNGELGKGMRGTMGTWGIWVGTGEIKVGMQGMGVGMLGIRLEIREMGEIRVGM